MMTKRLATIALACAMAVTMWAQTKTTGWGDFKIFLDPGHAQTENMGLYNYSEAQKVLRVALLIKQYLLTNTDIAATNIELCRTTDDEAVTLTERSDMANAWGADFYYSIHSDAGSTVNSTLTMFGGWRKDGVEIEKTPNGGKAFGEILCPNLTGAMRVSTRGNYYDRCYYDNATSHTNQYPYLSVNRRTNMPSLLSEAGFHTIDAQQSRNLNDDYKKLEALAAFQSLVKYRGLTLPDKTILTGVVTDAESGKRMDAVTVSVDGKSYTTDSWDSLFKNYTTDKDLIHNGFYLFEDLTAGKTYTVTFTADGYQTLTKTVTIKAGNQGATADYITFADASLLNATPARVASVVPSTLTNLIPSSTITLTFSRNMDRESVEQALSISPDGAINKSWANDKTLVLGIEELAHGTSYALTIDGNVAKNAQTNQKLDGDGDGAEGGNYVLNFTTAAADANPPIVESTYPDIDGNASFTKRPTIRIAYNKILNWDDATDANRVTLIDSDGTKYNGRTTHAVVGNKSVVHFYPAADLPRDKCMMVRVAAGLADVYGNETEEFRFKFLTEYRTRSWNQTVLAIDGATNFWAPATSGSTCGIIGSQTTVGKSAIGCYTSSPSSMVLNYAFDPSATDKKWAIRTHYSDGASTQHSDIAGVLSFWVYGDGSNNLVSARVYANSNTGGVKYRNPEEKIDFIGWKQVNWDMTNDEYSDFTGTDELTGTWLFDSFFVRHYDQDDMAWSGQLLFDQLEYNKYIAGTPTAKITDIEESGIDQVDIDAERMVDVYNLQGIMLRKQVDFNNATDGLPAGMYIVGNKKVVVAPH